MDRIDRTENMYRCVSMLTDTDSCSISFDGWYRYILDKTFNIPMKIKEIEIDEKTAEVKPAFETRYDYDFSKDDYDPKASDVSYKPDTKFQPGKIQSIKLILNFLHPLYISYHRPYQ